jgi:N-acetylneuraminic acid mutarotase
MLEQRRMMCGSHDPFFAAPPAQTTSTNASTLNVSVNFQPDGAFVPDGFRADSGRIYARRPSGLTYGWNVDTRASTYLRNSALSPTPAHESGNAFGDLGTAVWDMAVVNGYYEVRVVAGDVIQTDADYRIRAENRLVVNAKPTANDRWVEGTVVVEVTDGKLTLRSDSTAVNNRISFVHIKRLSGNPQLPFGNDPIALPGRIQAENFDKGRAGEAFSDTTVANLGNSKFRDSAVDISTIKDRTGRLAVTNTRPNEWLEYSVSVREAGTYAMNLRYAAGSRGGTLTVSSSATNASSRIELNSTGSFGTWQNAVVSDIELPAGTQVIRLRIQSSFQPNTDVASLNYFDFERVSDPPPESISYDTKLSNPMARYEAGSASVGDKLYVFGGFINSSIQATARSDVYDTANDTWQQIADLPVALTHMGHAADERFIYLVGGFLGDHPGNGSTAFFVYDTLTDTYSQGPDLPLARGAGGLALVNNRLHWFGGLDRAEFVSKDESDHWSIDLGRLSSDAVWEPRAAMPEARNHFGTNVLNGKIYAVGGQHLWNEKTGNVDRVDVYDPATDTWATGPSLPRARGHTGGSTLVFEDRLYVIGGLVNNASQSEPVADVAMLDPDIGTWTTLTPLPEARMSPVAAFINGKLVVSTGSVLGLQPRATTWLGELV